MKNAGWFLFGALVGGLAYAAYSHDKNQKRIISMQQDLINCKNRDLNNTQAGNRYLAQKVKLAHEMLNEMQNSKKEQEREPFVAKKRIGFDFPRSA